MGEPKRQAKGRPALYLMSVWPIGCCVLWVKWYGPSTSIASYGTTVSSHYRDASGTFECLAGFHTTGLAANFACKDGLAGQHTGKYSSTQAQAAERGGHLLGGVQDDVQ